MSTGGKGRYADRTEIPEDQSIREIKRLLERFGATSFAYGEEGQLVILGFTVNGRQVRFRFELPDPTDEWFLFTPTKRIERTEKARRELYEMEVRRKFRELKLVIQAKLASIEAGIETFESAFLAQILLPNGQTVGEYVEPQIATLYDTQQMPALLPGLGTGAKP